MERIIGIYKITSPSGRIYIGQTVNFKERLRHYRQMHCYKQRKLYASLKKYGFEKHFFEMLEHCELAKLNEIERYYQDKYNASSHSNLNIRLTQTSDKSGHLDIIAKNKISFQNSGIKNGMYGKTITEKAKALQRLALSGEKNYLSKLLINLETGIFYPCLREAGDTIGMDKRKLWSNIVIQKKNKTSFIYA